MTLDELRERIKEEVVLHEGDVADYQWRQMGLTNEATKLGVSGPDFGRLVNQVSLTVAPDLNQITEIKNNTLKLLRERRKQLTDADIRQLVEDAERVRLTRSFVVDTWLPALVKQLPATPIPEPVQVKPVIEPVAPSGETADTVRRKVIDILNDYKDYIPALAIRSLFRAISYDEAELSTAIWSYLQIHGYEPDGVSQGTTLREKITSTDWRYPVKVTAPAPHPPTLPPSPAPIVRSFTATPARVFKGQNVTLSWDVENLLAVTIDDLGEGLSPKNRGWIKPVRTADYTLFDANNNPLSTVRVEVVPRDRSGIYGVLFALALLGLICWFIKHTGSTEKIDRQPSRKERTSSQVEMPPARVTESKPVNEVAMTPQPTTVTVEPKVATPEPITVLTPTTGSAKERDEVPSPESTRAFDEKKTVLGQPSQTAKPDYEEATDDKPYDKIDKRTDEQGWRMAKKGTKWGYVNQNDEWVIEPQFEATSPFKSNTAAVFLNGQLMNINRAGEQIR